MSGHQRGGKNVYVGTAEVVAFVGVMRQFVEKKRRHKHGRGLREQADVVVGRICAVFDAGKGIPRSGGIDPVLNGEKMSVFVEVFERSRNDRVVVVQILIGTVEEIQEMKIMIVKPQVGKMHLPESFFGQIVSAGAVRDCRQIFGTAAKRLIGLLVFGDFG